MRLGTGIRDEDVEPGQLPGAVDEAPHTATELVRDHHQGCRLLRVLVDVHPAVYVPGLYDTVRGGLALDPVDVTRRVAHR